MQRFYGVIRDWRINNSGEESALIHSERMVSGT